MAQIRPPYEELKNMNPQPTEGEEKLVSYFNENLDDRYEVYFQPSLNGDKPDIVLMREGSGVMIIEVKDWNLEYYYCDSKGNFILKKNNIKLKSPFDQVNQYKDNLYNLHSEVLLKRSIFSSSTYGIVKCAVYFHNATVANVKKFMSSCDRETKNNIENYCIIIGSDSLNKSCLNDILVRTHLDRNSNKFDNEIYTELKRNFQPSIQEYENLVPIVFSLQQQKLIISKEGKQKIKGVAGSGKSLILAQRAANAYSRTQGKILILTYNITLKNYIHDKISKVRGLVNWSNFDINSYHKFIVFQMNNLGMPFEIEDITDIQQTDIFDKNYFSNEKLFDGYEDEISKYDAVFIDEVQDYEYEWLKIIEKYFLKKNGEYVIFGDEKQNIYKRELEKDKTMRVNISGRWSLLNKSYRLSTTMTQLIVDFQRQYLSLKYNIDEFDLNGIQTSIEDKLDYQEHIFYNNFNPHDICSTIYDRIRKFKINSNDVCIVGSNIDYLREIDEIIKKTQHEKTQIMSETKKEHDEIAEMLWKKYILGIPIEDQNEEKHKRELDAKLRAIRQSRKFNFWMNRGVIKLSTIHSFKGWEINTLVLLLDNTETITDELVYTGLTRCANNIIIINIGNLKYHEFFSTKMLAGRGIDT